jgi:NTE family protein
VGVQRGDVVSDANSPRGTLGIVLAGGGARGAYEMGALSVLLGELPANAFDHAVIVGTSVGAINAVLVGSLLDAGPATAARGGLRLWSDLDWSSVVAPVLSTRGVAPLLRYGAGVVGAGGRVDHLLDSRPLAQTLGEKLDMDRLAANVRAGSPQAVAVVATQTATALSVAFHDGGQDVGGDSARGINYVRTPLTLKHVLASSAVPALFRPIWIAGPRAGRGWYVDGSTRLNTPIKPALKLGIDRLIVIAANTIRPAAAGPIPRPDIFDGLGQVAQAALGDPLANDIATLAKVNDRVKGGPDPRKVVPYILIAPATPYRIGEIAQYVFRKHYATCRGLRTSPGLVGRLLQAGKSSGSGELFSYLFFAPEFFQALIKAGTADARAWLQQRHDDGVWQCGPLPP